MARRRSDSSTREKRSTVRRAPIAIGAVVLAVVSALILAAVSISGPASATVPTPTGNNAVITVRIGGDRTGTTTEGAVQGVVLGLYDDNGGTPTNTLASAAEATNNTCTSDAQGDCSFVIPNTTNTNGTNANRDRRFWVKQISAPAGYYLNGSLNTGSLTGPWATNAYQFRTGAQLRAGNTYDMSTFTTSNATQTSGTWQVSRTDPPAPLVCGLKVALIMDLSTSVAPNIADLKTAANAFVTALTGTPSSMSVFTFGTGTPAAGVTNLPNQQAVSTTAGADVVHNKINGYSIGNASYTNWDAGINQVAQSANQYDLAVIITDGNPTATANGTTNNNGTAFAQVENGIFSANALKAKGTRIVAIGVGNGVASGGNNLAAISGPTAGSDYYQTNDYSGAAQTMRDMALHNCTSTVSIIKSVVPYTTAAGSTAGSSPAGGWTFTANLGGVTGVTVGAGGTGSGSTATGTTADNTGGVNFNVQFGLNFPSPDASTPVTITETPQPGYTLQQQTAANAVCTDTISGTTLPVANVTNGFTLTAAANQAISCQVYNRQAPPTAKLTLVKNVANGSSLANATPNQWTLAAAGGPTPISGAGNSAAVTNQTVTAGTYTLGESGGPAGYTGSAWTCVDATTGAVSVNASSQVTLSAGQNVTCTVTNTAQTPKLTLIKVVNNTHGGTAQATAWTLSATGSGLTTISGATGSGAVTGANAQIGTYTLAESGGPAGYTASNWSCTGAAGSTTTTVTLALGSNAICTITNSDQAGTLTLVKTVDNGATGATTQATAWTLTASGPTSISGATGSGAVTNASVSAGSYALAEAGPAGYTASAWTCTGATPTGSAVVVPNGGTVTCRITNTAIPPKLTLTKVVSNTHGGTAQSTDWTLSAAGPTPLSGLTGVTNAAMKVGTYTLAETAIAGRPTGGYVASQWACTDALTGAVTTGASAVLVPGSNTTCTITNSDQAGFLTLVKTVDNGTTGATTPPTAWTLSATGPSTITGTTGAPAVTNAPVGIGSYALAEANGPTGYTASSWSCTGGTVTGSSVAVGSGANVVCTITNTVVAPKLTLVKTVDNGTTGATTQPTAWTLSATGPSTITGTTGAPAVTNAGAKVGTYALAEGGGPAGYTASAWTCVDAATGPVTLTGGTGVPLSPGSNVTCTITNTAQQPTLSLVKVVNHGATGDTTPNTAWTLTGAGPTSITGKTGDAAITAAPVKAGDYALSESGPAGYTASSWACVNAAGAAVPVTGGSTHVALGAAVTCTITNTAIAPKLTLVKKVVNSHGGTATADQWTLGATGPTPITGTTGSAAVTGAVVQVGGYTLGETNGPSGYSASAWDCGPATVTGGNGIALKPGGDVTCTITNTDQASTLTLTKTVDNGSTGATTQATAWTLSATGPSTHSGATGSAAVTNVAVDAGSYALGESGGPAGYTASAWTCTGGILSGSSVTVPSGGNVTCSITNTAVAPTLTLIKKVVNAHGGVATADQWTLSAAGQGAISSSTITGATGAAAVTGATAKVGTYDLSEAGGPTGYAASSWDCTGAAGATGATGASVTLSTGSAATCTITNTDSPATLTLQKIVDGSAAGSGKVPADWTLTATPDAIAGQGTVSGNGDPTSQGGVDQVAVFAGSYDLAEAGPAGFVAGSWICQGGVVTGSAVAVPSGGNVICQITNTAVTPTLTLTKTVEHGATGATDPATAWTLSAAGTTPISGATGDATVTDAAVKVGTYALSESGPAGYTATAWTCTGAASSTDTTVTVAEGDDASCAITNTAIAPKLTLVKVVNNGTTASTNVATDWTLSATGSGGAAGTSISGPTGDPSVTAAGVQVGAYALSEAGPAGYSASAWSCTGGALSGATVTLAPGADATCTITNTAIAPTLTLVKQVDNGTTGATTAPTAWQLTAAGAGATITGAVGDATVTNAPVQVGTYTLSEAGGPSGYTASAWTCTGADSFTSTTVTVIAGDAASCTIVNTAIVPTLTLQKVVDNGTSGATHLATDWTLSATGSGTAAGSTISGAIGDPAVTGAQVKAGQYQLAESGPTGYSASAWSCTGATVDPSGVVTTVPGTAATCSITNTAVAPKLTLVKVVDNGNTGGTAKATDWTLSATGTGPAAGTAISGAVGAPAVTGKQVVVGSYDLAEASGPAGYSASAWQCDGGALTGSSVALAAGDDVTCTITNTAIAPTLTVVKALGGPRIADTDQFTVLIAPTATTPALNDTSHSTTAGAGSTVTAGSGTTGATTVQAGTTYFLAESAAGTTNLALYGATVSCADGNGVQTALPSGPLVMSPTRAFAQITPVLGSAIVCTITNSPASYAVTKVADKTSVHPGDQLTYTVTVTNTGTVAYTDANPASFSDDLSTDVLDDASWVGFVGAPASGTQAYAAPVVSWSGALGVGAVVQVTYTVLVNTPDAGSLHLINAVTTPPGGGGGCATPGGCTTDTPVQQFTVQKAASASVVKPGETVTYTVTVTNTGAVDYTAGAPASFTDDLTDVLDDAVYNNDATASAGTPTYSAPALSWSGPLAVGTPVTVSYSVTVDSPDTGSLHLVNAVTTPPGGGGGCAAAPASCTTDTPVQQYTVAKTASASTVRPGDTLTYTVTVRNTGAVAYTGAAGDAASFADDLTHVLTGAAYNNDATNGATFAAGPPPVLSWSGALPVGGVVTVTYSVTVDNPVDAAALHLVNAVTTPPGGGGNCAPDPATCTTDTPVQSYSVVKKADVTVASPGDTVTYTITVTNTGDVDYTDAAPAGFTDDLTGVLDDAAYNHDALASGGTVTENPPTLEWSGALPVGAVVTVTYSVTINDPDAGDKVLTNVVVTPGGGGGDCPTGSTNPGCTTTTPTRSFDVVKKADKATVNPGDVVTYTITVTSTGTAAYTADDPASLDDSLADVLDDAAYNGDAAASDGTVSYASPVLSWQGPLAVGGTVTITYSVTVNRPPLVGTFGNQVLANVVVTPPGGGGSCPFPIDQPEAAGLVQGAALTQADGASADDEQATEFPADPSVMPPGCTTSTPVQAFTIAKTASSAGPVNVGDTLTYTVTVTNTGVVDFTGATPSTSASFTDDLSGVLDDASYNSDAHASAGTASYTAPILSWSGPLAVGTPVTVTYSVTVTAVTTGDYQLINKAGSTSPACVGSDGGTCTVGTVTPKTRPTPPPAPPAPPALAWTGAQAQDQTKWAVLLVGAGILLLLAGAIRRRPQR